MTISRRTFMGSLLGAISAAFAPRATPAQDPIHEDDDCPLCRMTEEAKTNRKHDWYADPVTGECVSREDDDEPVWEFDRYEGNVVIYKNKVTGSEWRMSACCEDETCWLCTDDTEEE